MATGRITKSTVDDIAPGLTDRFLWDDRLRGFGFKVTPKGARTYVLQYRTGGRNTPTKRVTIGGHGSPWTPTTARAEAERLLILVKQGNDPQQIKRERQRVMVDLAFDKYADRFLEIYGKRKWAPVTYNGSENYLRRYVKPVLVSRPLPSLKKSDMADIFDRIPSGKPALPRNIYAVLSKLFAWAIERGDLDRSPLEGFSRPATVPSRKRVLSDRELKFAWKASEKIGYPFGPILRLLILTAQRRFEVAGLSWAELDRNSAEWSIPGSRTKNSEPHVVPLSEAVILELDQLAGENEWPRRGFVFTTTGKTPASGHSRAKQRLDHQIAKLLPKDEQMSAWRVHDLRRTVATGFQRLGVRFEVTEAVLNHVSGSRSGVAGIYQRHHWRDEKRQALDAWAAHVQALIS
jgi:integrase